MIESTPSAQQNPDNETTWGDTIFDLQRRLSGGYNDPPSDDEALVIIADAEKLARTIEASGVAISASLKTDLSHFWHTAESRNLHANAPTLQRVSGN